NIFSALQFKNGIHLVEGQLSYRRWNRYARPELIGLKNSAIGQLASGDAGRKSQIIFDAHAAPGLTSPHAVIEHDRVYPFRGAINRSSQSRRPRTGDDT